MAHQGRSWWSATSALLPFATAAFAIAIFVAQLMTTEKLTAALFYVLVVLLAALFCNARGLVLVGAGCIGLTVLANVLPTLGGAEVSVVKTTIGAAVIGLTTFLALQSRSSEATLREQAALLDLTHDSIIARRFDDDVITYWNRGAEELYGWPRTEAVGRVGSEFRKNVAPLPLDEIKAELLGAGRWEGELVNNKRDGTPVLVASRWSLQRDRHGRPATIVVTSNDITERKRAEQALRVSEEQWREVFEHNPVMYFMLSPTGTVLSVNAFGASQLGYTAAELVGKSVLNVFFEEDRELVKAQLATCVEELGRSHNWEIRKICKNGKVIWVRENAKAVQRSGADAIVLIACEDITERRRGEQRVATQFAVTRILAEADSLAAAAPRLLQEIAENLRWDWGGLWSLDGEAAPLRCECQWRAPDVDTAEFDAVSREGTFRFHEGRIGHVWRSASPLWIADATVEPQFLRVAAATEVGLHGGVIFPILLDTEALGVVEFFSRAVRERDEEQLATLSAIGSQIGQFIKRRRAEAALRGSEERWRRLFETSAAGMALLRRDGVFTAANPALQRMLGRTEAEIVGRNVLELNHEDERAATAEFYAKIRSGLLTERQVEKKYLKKDGTPVWLNITTTLVPATDTAAPFLQSVYMDITERVRLEAALRASEARWRTVFETTAVGIVTTFDLAHGRYATANVAFQRMTGYTEDELRNLTVLDITPEEDRAATQKRIEEIVAGPQRSYRIERRFRHKNGEISWADINTFFIPATDGTPAFLAVVAVDITERKRAEEALRESEERFRALVQFSFDVYWESDAQHRFIRQEFAEGLADAPPPGSEIGKTRWEVPYVEPDEEAWRKHRETLDAHLPFRDFEHARPTPDGGKRYVSVSGLPVFDETGRFIGYRGVGRHITDRKRAEAALRASEERWRRMFETSAAGMATARLDGAFTAANPALQRMLDRTEDEIVGYTAMEITHEDERAETENVVARFRSGLQQEYHVEKRYRKKDGSPVWLNVTTTLVPATETAEPFLQAIYINITDRKRAEAALRASEARWRAVFETAPVGIATFDFEHRRYLTANESFQRMTGYTEAELRHLTTLELTHEDDRAATQERIDSGTVGVLQRKRYRRKDGEVLWADVTSFVVPATDSTPTFRGTVIVDITDRKRAEEALQQAQADLARLNRVMLLGEMTASIAHEVNQPIAATVTNAHAGLRWLVAQPPDLEEIRQVLGRIVRDGGRAGEVIGRIRALVKKVPPRRDRSDINEAIREVIALTQTEVQQNRVRLQMRLADDLPVVPADRIQLQQVIMNLIVNAIEAMSGAAPGTPALAGGGPGGELTIASGKYDANAVFVEVQDTGPGFDPEKLDQLFQSFYTTKPDGIGMGLAISRSIVEAHGGRLSAAPNEPRGAVFRFTLPVEEQSSEDVRYHRVDAIKSTVVRQPG